VFYCFILVLLLLSIITLWIAKLPLRSAWTSDDQHAQASESSTSSMQGCAPIPRSLELIGKDQVSGVENRVAIWF
jgi:hypothetical protein